MSGFWNFTYCIPCDNLELLEQALTRILEQEGLSRIPLPPLSIDEIKERYRYSWQLSRDLWMLGLFVGACGWTIVKTNPQELLCLRAIGASRPRLSELAIKIGCDAFYLGVYEYGGILMEADAGGRVFISGSIGEEYSEKGKFFEEQIDSQKSGRFFLLDVPEEMQRAKQLLKEEEIRRFEQWQEQFLEDYIRRNFPQMASSELEKWKARFKENRTQVFEEEVGKQLYEALTSEASLEFGGRTAFELFDKALARLLGGTRSYWDLGRDPLIYRAYTQQQQMAADGARLLYFQPTDEHYLQIETRGIRGVRRDLIARSNLELKRLGWTNQQGREYLLRTYGKRSRLELTDEEMLEFLRYLESQPSPGA